jgi:hypothetical protein
MPSQEFCQSVSEVVAPIARTTSIVCASDCAVHTGVVIVHAAWSAYSAACLACLVATLSKLGDRPPALWIIDADEIGVDAMNRLYGAPHSEGRGETIWFRDGKIIARKAAYGGSACASAQEVTASLKDADPQTPNG